jgi:hypothetical protein
MLHPKCYRCAGPCQMQLSVGVTVYTHHAAPWCKRCFAADVVSCHAQLCCSTHQPISTSIPMSGQWIHGSCPW